VEAALQGEEKPAPREASASSLTNDALRAELRPILRFLHDEGVPFDINQGQRDIRMACVKRKVS